MSLRLPSSFVLIAVILAVNVPAANAQSTPLPPPSGGGFSRGEGILDSQTGRGSPVDLGERTSSDPAFPRDSTVRIPVAEVQFVLRSGRAARPAWQARPLWSGACRPFSPPPPD